MEPEPEPAPSSPPPTSFGVFGGAFPTTTGADAAPSPEWSKQAPSTTATRSPSRSPAVRSPPTASIAARSPAHSRRGCRGGGGRRGLTPSRWIRRRGSAPGRAAGVDEAEYAGGLAPGTTCRQPLGLRRDARRARGGSSSTPRVGGARVSARCSAPRSISAGASDARATPGVIEALGPDPETTRLAAAAHTFAVGLPAEKAARRTPMANRRAEGLLTPSGRANTPAGEPRSRRLGGAAGAPTAMEKPFARRLV